MVHLNPMPGAPLYDAEAGIEGIVEAARRDLTALQDADVDAVMFGNENDRPYELAVDVASTATMAYVIGRLRGEIAKPFGVNVLWDPKSSVALATATGASFMREILTGTYASDMGPWTPNAGETMRYRNRLGRSDLVMLDNVSAEFADSMDRRPSPTGHVRLCSHPFPMPFWCRERSPVKPPMFRTSKPSSGYCRTRRFWPIRACVMQPSPTSSRLPMAALLVLR